MYIYTNPIRDFSRSRIKLSTNLIVNTNRLQDLSEILFSRRHAIVKNIYIDENIYRQLGLILLYGSVHFCFVNPYSKKEFSFKFKGEVYKRSTGFLKALAQADINWSNFKEITKLTLTDWHNILQTDQEDNLFLLNKRHRNIINFASYLVRNGFATTHDLLKRCTDGEKLLKIMIHSSFFKDIFLKRAQVTTYLFSKTLSTNRLSSFTDIAALTAMPDYRLPQLLYNFGIINLSESLKNKLLSQICINEGSDEETDLRAAVVVIVEKISKIINVCEAEVDSIMWGFSQELLEENKLDIPAMAVATEKY